MKDVQCYELFGGIALNNHAFMKHWQNIRIVCVSPEKEQYVIYRRNNVQYNLCSGSLHNKCCTYIHTSMPNAYIKKLPMKY